MTLYAKISVNLPADPKMEQVGIHAELLYIRCVLGSREVLSDGFVTPRNMARWGVGCDEQATLTSLAAKLVEAGLWEPREGGWSVPDRVWREWNPTRDEIEHARRVEADRQRAWRQKKRNERQNPGSEIDQNHTSTSDVDNTVTYNVTNGVGNAVNTDGETDSQSQSQSKRLSSRSKTLEGGPGETITTTETPLAPLARQDSHRPRGTQIEPADIETGFADFWLEYPRRVGKPSAVKAWRRSIATAEGPTIRAGLAAWTRYWHTAGTDAEHIPHPTTWLNDRRWEDTPPTPNGAKPQVNGQRAMIERVAERLSEPDPAIAELDWPESPF